MHRRQLGVAQLGIISLCILLVSSSLTFIVLYLNTPRSASLDGADTKVAFVPPITHDAPSKVVVSAPVSVRIDSIDLVADVNPVGLTNVGDMDIDDDPQQAAWYKLGPKPGEEGSAVIAGHYGWRDGVGSLFNNLNKLVKGDVISTVDENGQVKEFIVTRSALYAPNQDATDVFKSDDGKAHLNLVTCQGLWSDADRTYTERLVIFTDLVK